MYESTRGGGDQNLAYLDASLSYSKPIDTNSLYLDTDLKWTRPDGSREYLDAVPGWTAPVMGPQSQEDFDALSWDEIKQLEANDIDRLIKVGVTRDVELRWIGTFSFQLVHGAAYDRADGQGQNKMVFLSKDCTTESIAHSSYDNLQALWGNASDIKRVYLDETVWNALPADLQSNIVEVNLPCFKNFYTYGSNKCPELTYVKSKLFLPSVPEIFDETSSEADGYFTGIEYPKPGTGTLEGSTYKWFQIHNTSDDRVKKFNGLAKDWWLRSPISYYGEFYFDYVYAHGRGIHCAMTPNRKSLAPAFCL